jgi:diguanylate cyclase (GGDEF)-like protein
MHEVILGSCDPDELRDEIARLRSLIARLEDRVVELDRMAHLDPLLEVANRRGLMRELDSMIARHERHETGGAVLFVDLNGLKLINDKLGHAGGDLALVHVAEQLRSGVRLTDCVARLGGDEFCVLLERVDQASAVETVDRLVDLVASREFVFAEQRLFLSVAIGMTMVERGDTPAQLLARADRAMYQVKDEATHQLVLRYGEA